MYEASLMQKWDYQNGIDYAVRTAVEKAEKKTITQMVKGLKLKNVSVAVISEVSGLSIEEIERL